MLLQAQFVYGHNTGVRVFARRSVLISLAIPRRGQNYLKSILEKCQATMFCSDTYIYLLCHLKLFKNELEWLHNAMALTCLHT